jgi:murein DD-endopeptidase MepM/ murein hydrolase activator NlpD
MELRAMTAFGAAIRRAAGRVFRDRQVIVRTDGGVVARTIRRRTQILAATVLFGATVWCIASAMALVAAGNGLAVREARLAGLQQDRARIAAELAAREADLAIFTQRDRDAALVLADLNRQIGVLERARRTDRAALAELAEARQALAERLSRRTDALAEATAERDRLAERVEAQAFAIAESQNEREGLAVQLAETRQALLEARSWNASVGAGFARLGSTVYEASRLMFAGEQPSGLVLALDDAERRIAALESQRSTLIDGAMRLWEERNRAADRRGLALAAMTRSDAALDRAEAAARMAEGRHRASVRHAARLWERGNTLGDALGAMAAQADAADAARRAADARAEHYRAQMADAYGNAHALWARGNALVDLVDTLTAELQRARIEAAELRLAQQQFFGEIREHAEAHIDAVEEGLAFTGLDIDSLILAMTRSADGSGLGGPMIPALTGRPLNEAMWAEASDIVVLIDRAATLRDIANALPIGLPVQDSYRLSSGFGTRTDPFTGRVARHHGLDFAARHGTPIYATAPGRVVRAGWRGAYGYMVEIEHELGISTRYAHLSAVLVEENAEVEYGDRIGLLGSTGRSSGPHLHYEVRVTGDPRNPIRFIRAGQNVFQAAN